MKSSIAKFDSLFVKAQNSHNTIVTLSTLMGNAQPWWLFNFLSLLIFLLIVKRLNSFTLSPKCNYNYYTTLPLQGYLVNCCLGRKDRLNGGFFISGIGKAV